MGRQEGQRAAKFGAAQTEKGRIHEKTRGREREREHNKHKRMRRRKGRGQGEGAQEVQRQGRNRGGEQRKTATNGIRT